MNAQPRLVVKQKDWHGDSDQLSALVQAGRNYEKLFVPALFKPWTKHLIARSNLKDDDIVLDVACGTGVLARSVKDKLGKFGAIYGIDSAIGMIKAAAELHADIPFVYGAAEKLPWRECEFDQVFCQFGLMYFDNPQKAISEMFRVLKPGGRLTISVWASLDENPGYREVVSALLEDECNDLLHALVSPFSMPNDKDVRHLIQSAGFDEVETSKVAEKGHFDSAAQFLEAEVSAWIPHHGQSKSQFLPPQILTKTKYAMKEYTDTSGKIEISTVGTIFSSKK